MSEKVDRLGIQRDSDMMYYIKQGAVWASPRKQPGKPKGKAVKIDQVGRELGVAYVLEGSVRKAGQRVRVTGELINANNGGHVWADRYDRDLTDIFAIQDEITHAIVQQLKVKLLPQEKKSIAQLPTDNVEAYTYYLRGRDFLYRFSKRYFELARRMFVKARRTRPGLRPRLCRDRRLRFVALHGLSSRCFTRGDFGNLSQGSRIG